MFLYNRIAVYLIGFLLILSSFSGLVTAEQLSFLDGQVLVERSGNGAEWQSDTLVTPRKTTLVPKEWGQVRGILKCGDTTFVVSQFAIARYNERNNTLERLAIVVGNNTVIGASTFVRLGFTEDDCELAMIEKGPADNRNFFVQIIAKMRPPNPEDILDTGVKGTTSVTRNSDQQADGGITMVIGVVRGTNNGVLTRHLLELVGIKAQERRVISWEWAKIGGRYPAFNLNAVDPGILHAHWTGLTLNLKDGRLTRLVPVTRAGWEYQEVVEQEAAKSKLQEGQKKLAVKKTAIDPDPAPVGPQE